MIVLSKKCSETILLADDELDLALTVVEISAEAGWVRLLLAPQYGDGAALDVRRADTGEDVLIEVRTEEHRSQAFLWADRRFTLRINDRVDVRIVGGLEPDRVNLEIAASPRSDAPHGGTISPRKLSECIAKRITAFIKARPRGAVGKLAKSIGVSPVTITRWRKGETNVTTEHLRVLLRELGVGPEELAAELGVTESDLLPDVRTRGPAGRDEKTPPPAT